MKKIVIITGQTASGKSALAVKLAREYNGEIISADSVQIYKGLDIGSAKEEAKTMEEIPHHLIDIKEPTETYNVGDYIVDCDLAIKKVLSKNKLPIIVGGTGLYIKALINGYTLGGVSANPIFREEMQSLAKTKGNEYVWGLLNQLNPTRAQSVHYNNLKRVIRYIEIEKFGDDLGKAESILKDYETICVGIVEDRKTLYSKIDARADQMIQMGLEDEMRILVSKGVNRQSQSTTSIGYREWFDYFDNIIDLQTTINLIKQHARNYAKRQLTFLKTLDGVDICTIPEAENKIKEFLNDRN